jgi:hypothetical protein
MCIYKCLVLQNAEEAERHLLLDANPTDPDGELGPDALDAPKTNATGTVFGSLSTAVADA